MKQKIRVYLQYPWRFSEGTYYKFLLDYPPKNVVFSKKEEKNTVSRKNLFQVSKILKKVIKKSLNIFNYSVPNAHLSPKGNYDLIHCAHCLSRNKDKPWVGDIEGVFQFYIGKKSEKTRKKIVKILLRENCKKILPWTKSAEKEIRKEFPEVKEKIKTIYPAVSLPKIKREKHNGINLLFIGRYFYEKGGLHALEAMNKLTKKHDDIKCVLISEVPKEIKKKFLKNKKIKIGNLVSQKKLFKEVYPKADIFIYPGYADSFGFALLEAMSFGIPVVTIDGFARKEIVKDGKTGFVIKPIKKFDVHSFGYKEESIVKDRIIDEIVKKTLELIKNKKLREKMSKNCLKEIKNGNFSIKKRNSQLKKIYQEAIK